MSKLNYLGLAFVFRIDRFPFEQIKLTKITFIATLFEVRFNLGFFQGLVKTGCNVHVN